MKTKKVGVISVVLIIIVSLLSVSCAKNVGSKSVVNSQSPVLFSSESEYVNYMNKEFPDSKAVFNYNEKKRYISIIDNIGSVHLKYFLGFDQQKNMNLEGVSLVNLSGKIEFGFIGYDKSSSSIIGKFEVRVNKNQENNTDVLKKLEKEYYQERDDYYVKIINVNIPLKEATADRIL